MFRKALLVLGSFATVMMTPGVALAQEGAAATGGVATGAMAAAVAIAIAAFGGAIGQGIATKAALEGIARNPSARQQIFVPMIIGLALIESLVLYAFVIALIKT